MELVIQEIARKYAPLVITLLVLVAADVLSGILSALKRGAFNWRALADVYRTNVVPKIGGWVIVTLLVETLTRTANLPDIANTILLAVNTFGFYPLVIADLLASLVSNLQELAKPLPPPAPPTETVADLRARHDPGRRVDGYIGHALALLWLGTVYLAAALGGLGLTEAHAGATAIRAPVLLLVAIVGLVHFLAARHAGGKRG